MDIRENNKELLRYAEVYMNEVEILENNEKRLNIFRDFNEQKYDQYSGIIPEETYVRRVFHQYGDIREVFYHYRSKVFEELVSIIRSLGDVTYSSIGVIAELVQKAETTQDLTKSMRDVVKLKNLRILEEWAQDALLYDVNNWEAETFYKQVEWLEKSLRGIISDYNMSRVRKIVRDRLLHNLEESYNRKKADIEEALVTFKAIVDEFIECADAASFDAAVRALHYKHVYTDPFVERIDELKKIDAEAKALLESLAEAN